MTSSTVQSGLARARRGVAPGGSGGGSQHSGLNRKSKLSAQATRTFFWLLLRALGALQTSLPMTTWGSRHPALRSLIPLFGRVLRVVVFVLGLLTVIAQFGYPIATILAGLGIGGIAVALGAQKSFEHFFGSVSISVDQPFRVGDWVSAGGVSGSIESIGLRSTRIRTLARTIVTVPNGVLAEQQSENFGVRDRMVLKAVLGLEYGTSSKTLRKIRDDIETYLSDLP